MLNKGLGELERLRGFARVYLPSVGLEGCLVERPFGLTIAGRTRFGRKDLEWSPTLSETCWFDRAQDDACDDPTIFEFKTNTWRRLLRENDYTRITAAALVRKNLRWNSQARLYCTHSLVETGRERVLFRLCNINRDSGHAQVTDLVVTRDDIRALAEHL